MAPRWEIDDSRKFVNPYHFVRLDEAGCARQGYPAVEEQSELLTGWIDCSLTTLTPLFVPNSSSNDILAKRDESNPPECIKSYDFYSYTDLSTHTPGKEPSPGNPVIPGSELRGAIRSAFEAVTRSCMLSDNHETLYKRTTTAGKPGFLYKDGNDWWLEPCRRYGVATRSTLQDKNDYSSVVSSFPEGQRVCFSEAGEYLKTDRGGQPVKDWQGKVIVLFTFVKDIRKLEAGEKLPLGQLEGYYHRGEPYGSKKHHESAFAADPLAEDPPFKVTKDAVDRLFESRRLYADSSVNHHLGTKMSDHKGYPAFVRSDTARMLVYWSRPAGPDGPVYLSPSAIGREVFVNTLNDILKSRGEYGACADSSKACPACQLFGMVKQGQALAGRLRIGEAQLVGSPTDLSTLYHPFVCLPELASPKVSATEFYVAKPSVQARLWNYDYVFLDRQDGRPDKDGKPYSAELRGRKFYWHQKARDVERQLFGLEAPPTATKRNVFVRALKSGLSFRFRVFFDRVSATELNRLLWVLSIGGRSTGLGDSPYGLKVGMGKPFGLGSVSLSPTAVTFRHVVLDRSTGTVGYHLTSSGWRASFGNREEEQRLLGVSRETLNDFLLITDAEHAPKSVDYPRTSSYNDKESYRWFVANKMARSGSTPMNPAVNQALPDIEHPQLSSYRETS
jgi:CRISPR-associated protein (TIGR03986 family)